MTVRRLGADSWFTPIDGGYEDMDWSLTRCRYVNGGVLVLDSPFPADDAPMPDQVDTTIDPWTRTPPRLSYGPVDIIIIDDPVHEQIHEMAAHTPPSLATVGRGDDPFGLTAVPDGSARFVGPDLVVSDPAPDPFGLAAALAPYTDPAGEDVYGRARAEQLAAADREILDTFDRNTAGQPVEIKLAEHDRAEAAFASLREPDLEDPGSLGARPARRRRADKRNAR